MGRGIGLAVARALVQAHGGTVRAFSDGSMQGSRFVVRLALPGDTNPAQAAPAGADLHARWARLIGLVDLTSDP